MNTSSLSTRLISFFLTGVLFSLSAWGLFFTKTSLIYPVVEIEVQSAPPIGVHFLFYGQQSIDVCENLTGKISRSVLSNCKTCRVKSISCLEQLSSDQSRLLSDAPWPEPTGQMANGVVTFTAENSELALTLCKASEANSVNSTHSVRCFPANHSRPSTDTAISVWWSGKTAIQVGLSAFAALLAFVPLYQGLTGASPIYQARLLEHRLSQKFLSFPRLYKQALMALIDVVGLITALWLAFSLRLEAWYWPSGELVWLFLGSPLLAIPIFVRFGLYRAIIRFLGAQALRTLFLAVVIYAMLFALLVLLGDFSGVPKSVLIIYPVLSFLLIGIPRFMARDWLRRSLSAGTGQRKSVLIYGAGSAGIQLSAGLIHSREWRPVGLLDDDPALTGQIINGLKVFSAKELPEVIQAERVMEILLAIPSVTRARRNEIINQLESLPVHVRTLPGLADLAEGKVQVEDLREVDIEDLLGRDPVPPNPSLLGSTISGKVVLVSGAGGSIGSELCRQIVRLGPTSLILYENSEFALYAIEQELLCLPVRVPVYPILGSVVDQARMAQVLVAYGVQTIFHAAAYKHVPMVEKNPQQGVINNIFGTWHAASAALDHGVETFVLISTDKAVRPTNTMGTTKRFAEMILQSLHAQFPKKTRFTMVRFGNVLGSSGSVVPLFREQIRRGGPVTVTDPRVIRYFMTIPEAAQLVIQAGAMGNGQDVFVLDMGEPVKILDLAKRMIHLSGLSVRDAANPHGEIEIVFSGLRPGEKLYEELLIGDNVTPTEHPRIMRADEKCLPWETLSALLVQLESACKRGDSDRIRALLLEAVEEFKPQCGNEDLLAKLLT
jgi:FlaA1/EpsC-like NDP-sugar epimerase